MSCTLMFVSPGLELGRGFVGLKRGSCWLDFESRWKTNLSFYCIWSVSSSDFFTFRFITVNLWSTYDNMIEVTAEVSESPWHWPFSLSLSVSSMTLIIMGSVIEWKCCHLPVIAAQSGSNTQSVLLRRGQTFTSVCASIFLLYMLFTLSDVPDAVCTARFLSIPLMIGFLTIHYIV